MPDLPPDDGTLVAACRGDQDALATLYRRHQPALLGWLRVKSPEAEDLAAEVWLGVARSLPGFVGDERSFRAWLFTLGRRRLVDHHRRRARRPEDPVPGSDLDGAGSGPDPSSVVLSALGAEEARALIARHLTDDQADVVLLRVLAGFDVAEVATVLGKRPGTVRVLQHRGLQRLADVLGQRSREEV